MKPIVPPDFSLSATPTSNRSHPEANYYITLRRCDQHGEEKYSFYWGWKGPGKPTVADVLEDLTARVKTVVGFTSAPEWICAANPNGTASFDRLQALTREFASLKRTERKLHKFLGRGFAAALGLDS